MANKWVNIAKNMNKLQKHLSLFTNHHSLAFTLAEVLITLGIIGIVAAMTVPSLYNEYQKDQYAIALKKVYSAWNQVIQKVQADYGCIGNLACTGLFASGTTTAETLGAALVPYFKVAKDCGISTDQNCWATFNIHYDGSGNNNNLNTNNTYYKFVITDGMSMGIYNYSDNCSTDRGDGSLNWVCFAIDFDINGLKSPNRAGRDVFSFRVTKDGQVFIAGTVYDLNPYTTYCNASLSAIVTNTYCAGKIQAEGWKMNY